MQPAYPSFRKLVERFVPVTDADWALLEPHLKERSVKKGDCMLREGETGRELGYVVGGTMRHYYTKDGEEKTTYFYFENALVGPYVSCITGQPSLITFEAITDTHLLVFPYSVMQSLYTKSHVWERFGRVLAEYLAMGLEERMVSLLTLSPQERYLELLQGNKQKIVERIPQHLIANYLGITPVSLSRIRNRVHKK